MRANKSYVTFRGYVGGTPMENTVYITQQIVKKQQRQKHFFTLSDGPGNQTIPQLPLSCACILAG